MIAFGIEWLEGDDGFIAEYNGAELKIKPGRGRTWKQVIGRHPGSLQG